MKAVLNDIKCNLDRFTKTLFKTRFIKTPKIKVNNKPFEIFIKRSKREYIFPIPSCPSAFIKLGINSIKMKKIKFRRLLLGICILFFRYLSNLFKFIIEKAKNYCLFNSFLNSDQLGYSVNLRIIIIELFLFLKLKYFIQPFTSHQS